MAMASRASAVAEGLPFRLVIPESLLRGTDDDEQRRWERKQRRRRRKAEKREMKQKSKEMRATVRFLRGLALDVGEEASAENDSAPSSSIVLAPSRLKVVGPDGDPANSNPLS